MLSLSQSFRCFCWWNCTVALTGSRPCKMPAEGRLMKIFRKSFVYVILMGTGFLIGWWIHDRRNVAVLTPLHLTETGPTVERIRELQYLTTLRVNVADALVTELDGRVGAVKAVIVVRGEVTIGVDLSQARFDKLDFVRHSGLLVLPSPQLENSGLDHDKTKVVALCPSGLWMLTPGEGDADAAVTNSALWQAGEIMVAAANDPQNLLRARQQARQVIETFLAGIGWQIIVRWNDGDPAHTEQW